MTYFRLDSESILALRDQAIEADQTAIAILSAEEPKHRFLDVNEAFERITGYSAGEVLDRSFRVLAGPRTSGDALARVQAALDENRTYSGTMVCYRADETPLWVDVTTASKRAEDGELACILLTLRDASAFVRAHAALTLVRRLSDHIRGTTEPTELPGAVASLMVPMFADWCAIHTLNDDGSLSLAAVTHAEQEAPASAGEVDVRGEGIGAVAMSGITLMHQPSSPHNPVIADQLSRIVGQPVHAAVSAPIASDGAHTFGAITWGVTDDKRQFADEDVEIVEDVGTRLGYFNDTIRVRENLSQALRTRETFLSVAGHELRTPVVSIKGYAQLLMRDVRRHSLSPQRLENGLRTIESSAAKLSALIEDLFTVYNRGSATVPLSLTAVRIETYLREFFTTAQSHLLHGHTIDLSGIRSAGWVNIDVIRFAQVLYNLLNNAERFSPPTAPIRIAIAEQQTSVIITVTDDGKGLEPGEETTIFDPFAGPRRHADQADAGLGISLYISQQIVQRHEGRIWAESAGPNKGTTFKIQLPLAPDPAA